MGAKAKRTIRGSRLHKSKKSRYRTLIIVDKVERKVGLEDKQFIQLKNADGRILNEFFYDKGRTKPIKKLSRTKKANEKVLIDYYKSKSKDYKPLSRQEYDKRFIKFVNKHKRQRELLKEIEEFKTTPDSRLLKSNRRIPNIKYDYMYIRVKVKLYWNGHYSYAYGRSDYFYRRLTRELQRKEYKHYKDGIPEEMKERLINSAIRRAIAPYGYDLDYQLVNWWYVYHQDKLRSDY